MAFSSDNYRFNTWFKKILEFFYEVGVLGALKHVFAKELFKTL